MHQNIVFTSCNYELNKLNTLASVPPKHPLELFLPWPSSRHLN